MEEQMINLNKITNQEEMKRKHYHPFPTGAKVKEIHKANLASSETTEELVKNDEIDAFYFRSLENRGIKLNKSQL